MGGSRLWTVRRDRIRAVKLGTFATFALRSMFLRWGLLWLGAQAVSDSSLVVVFPSDFWRCAATHCRAKKRATSRSQSAIDKGSKGLRHFSLKVCQKVKQKGITTYNEVCASARRAFLYALSLHRIHCYSRPNTIPVASFSPLVFCFFVASASLPSFLEDSTFPLEIRGLLSPGCAMLMRPSSRTCLASQVAEELVQELSVPPDQAVVARKGKNGDPVCAPV